MIPVPSEDELKKYLLRSSNFTHLPPYSELEPGSFLYYVKEIWEREQDRDGRRGHISESEISEKISQLIDKKFTRNQFQSLFGAGRRDQKLKSVVPRDVAEAFLTVAFTHWSSEIIEENGKQRKVYERILPNNNIDINELVSQISFRMYSPDLPVRCAPASGLGPLGFYRQSRKDNCSIIIATARQHIVMNDPGGGLFDWIENIRTFFRDIEIIDTQTMHIWVVKEPIISNDSRVLASIYDIGMLKTAFMTARAMCLTRDTFPSWEKVARQSIIVMLLNKNNNKYRQKQTDFRIDQENPIEEYFIFPDEVPVPWQSQEENLSAGDLNFITTVHDNQQGGIKIEYNIFLHKGDRFTPPVVKKSRPSNDSDRNFRNLYLCCLDYINSKRGNSTSKLLTAAEQHGWRFYTAEEFLNIMVP